MTLGREIKTVEDVFINIEDLYGELSGKEIKNVVYHTESGEDLWVSKSTYLTAEFRGEILSSYVRWSLAINGLHLGANRYRQDEWKNYNMFTVKALRMTGENSAELENIVEWSGDKASENHARTTLMMSSWAIIDMFGLIEKYIFKLFDIFIRYNPEHLLRGKEYRDLRRIFRARKDSDENEELWEIKFSKRIEQWKRKRLYDGISKVLTHYIKITKIYDSDPARWDVHPVCINGISSLRNALIHGEEAASKELADIFAHNSLRGLKLEEGDTLMFNTEYLQNIELYLNRFITDLNHGLMSLVIQQQA